MQRQQTLSNNGAGIKRNLQEAEKEYNIARTKMQGIAQQLAQMGVPVSGAAKGRFTTSFPVKAPISGTVSDITASLGSYADMQTPLMTVRDNSAVECDLNVYEKDIDKVKVGDRVLLAVTNAAGRKICGEVYCMNRHFTDGTKSVVVHVRLQTSNLKSQSSNLFDGEYVSGSIAIGRQRSKTLPSNAIVRSDGKSYIFALNGKPDKRGYRFSRHEVTTGGTSEGYTAVTLCKHIRQGQEIVTDNVFYLASMTSDHGED